MYSADGRVQISNERQNTPSSPQPPCLLAWCHLSSLKALIIVLSSGGPLGLEPNMTASAQLLGALGLGLPDHVLQFSDQAQLPAIPVWALHSR